MSSSRAFKRLEWLFSRLGVVCQIVGAFVLMLIAGNYLLGGAAFVYNLVQTGETGKVDLRYRSPVYDGDPERIAYWKEFEKAWATHFEPYVHWKRDEFHGRFINVDREGIRRTVKDGVRPGSTKVFMFGGSTLWGTGAPDSKTIPSYVQALLGPDYDVYNFGETGYVAAQELNALLLLLAQGRRPGVVIFYDGVNDGYAGTYSPAIPRDPHNLRMRDKADRSLAAELLSRSKYRKFLELVLGDRMYASWERKIAPSIDEHSIATIGFYEAHIKQVKALAQAYGFEACFFWQPNLFSLTRTHLTPWEKNTIEKASTTLLASQQAVYEVARQRLSGRQDENIFFLGNIFDGVKAPVYVDWHHVGPNGNRIIAEAMVRSCRLHRDF